MLAGRRTEAIQVADWLKKRCDTEYFSAAIVAQVLARLGERDEAMF